jgi:hypothetical protein
VSEARCVRSKNETARSSGCPPRMAGNDACCGWFVSTTLKTSLALSMSFEKV